VNAMKSDKTARFDAFASELSTRHELLQRIRGRSSTAFWITAPFILAAVLWDAWLRWTGLPEGYFGKPLSAGGDLVVVAVFFFIRDRLTTRRLDAFAKLLETSVLAGEFTADAKTFREC
jgi:hypothetical protein